MANKIQTLEVVQCMGASQLKYFKEEANYGTLVGKGWEWRGV